MSHTPPAQPTATKLISVFLIDDNEEFCTVFSAALSEDPNIRCSRCFTRCEHAIEFLQQEPEKPDVILLDIELPGMWGLDAIEPLKKVSPHSHIVMLTIHDHDRNIIRAVAAGASGYLLKSSTPAEVLSAIEATMTGGAPMHPIVIQKLLRMFPIQDIQDTDGDITEREKDILRYVVEGLTIESIAKELNVAYHTAKTHLKHIYAKLNVHTRSALAAKVLKQRLL
ncbi:MAG: response regulator transcription factor [Ignavibacteriales bacterium]|nr:response regulator transcription factor [Ignavibacteriales bacterium]